MNPLDQLRDEIANLHLLADRLASAHQPTYVVPSAVRRAIFWDGKNDPRGLDDVVQKAREAIEALDAAAAPAHRSPSHDLVEAADALRVASKAVYDRATNFGEFEGVPEASLRRALSRYAEARHAEGAKPSGAPVPASAQGEVCEKPDAASPVKPCPWCLAESDLSSERGETHYWYYVACSNCSARGPWERDEERAVEAWNRRSPAPSPATGESAIEQMIDNEQAALSGETLRHPSGSTSRRERAKRARAEHASIRAEVDRLRTALAEKEKAGVDVEAVVQTVRDAHFKWEFDHDDERDLLECLCDALRTALGAKETK